MSIPDYYPETLRNSPTAQFGTELADICEKYAKKFRNAGGELTSDVLKKLGLPSDAKISVQIGGDFELQIYKGERACNPSKFLEELQKHENNPIFRSSAPFANEENRYAEFRLEPKIWKSTDINAAVNYAKAIGVMEGVTKSMNEKQNRLTEDHPEFNLKPISFGIKSNHWTMRLCVEGVDDLSIQPVGLAAITGILNFASEGAAFNLDPDSLDHLYPSGARRYSMGNTKSQDAIIVHHPPGGKEGWIEFRMPARREHSDPLLTLAGMLGGAWKGVENAGQFKALDGFNPIMKSKTLEYGSEDIMKSKTLEYGSEDIKGLVYSPAAHGYDITMGLSDSPRYPDALIKTRHSPFTQNIFGKDLVFEMTDELTNRYKKHIETSFLKKIYEGHDMEANLRKMRSTESPKTLTNEDKLNQIIRNMNEDGPAGHEK